MAEDKAEQVVKPEADPTPASTDVADAPTPSSEQLEASAAEAKPEGDRVPLSRLNEVIEQRNKERVEKEEFRKRLEALEKPREEVRQTRAERYAKRLVSEGVEEGAAKLIAKVSEDMASEIAGEYIQPLILKSAEKETAGWIADFRKTAPDYDAVEPEMNKVFSAMSEAEKNFIVSDPKRIKMLYATAKMGMSEEALTKAREAGKSEAYQTKELKKQLSSGGGGAAVPPKKTVGRKDILDMSDADWQTRKAEILELARQGKL